MKRIPNVFGDFEAKLSLSADSPARLQSAAAGIGAADVSVRPTSHLPTRPTKQFCRIRSDGVKRVTIPDCRRQKCEV